MKSLDSAPRKRGRPRKTHIGSLVAYIRVSTDEQANGPEAQRAAIGAHAQRLGATVVAWCEDLGVSGAAPMDQRDGWLAAISAARDLRAGTIVVAKRDRLARSIGEAVLAERLASTIGARIISADGVSDDDTPEAAMMRGMLDLFAQYERACIRMRTRAALATKRARGERTGGIPYGMRLAACGKRLEPDPIEQANVDAIVAWRAAGETYRSILERLTSGGFKPRGSRWHVRTLRMLVASRTGNQALSDRSGI